MIVVKTWFTNAWLNASLRNENNQSTKLSYSIQYPSIYLLAHKTQDLVTINYTIIRKLNLPVYSYRNDLIFLINYLHIDLNILVRSFCSLVEHTMVQGEIYVVPYIILLISQWINRLEYPKYSIQLNLQGLMISGNPSFWHSAVNLRNKSGFSSLTRGRGPFRSFSDINTPVHVQCFIVLLIKSTLITTFTITVVSWVSAHGRITITLDFQRTGRLPSQQENLNKIL